MKDFLLKLRGFAAVAAVALAAMLPSDGALAQAVVQQPAFVQPHAVLDLGNGPTELQALIGNGFVFSSQGSGVGSVAAGTALVLTATPAIPPIVGGFITCNTPTSCTIPANTTVTAYNGTTGITLSASSTVTAVQVNWGAACPVSTQLAPVVPNFPMAPVTAGVSPGGGSGLYMYTQARVCAYGGNGPGMQFVNFAPGAH